MRLFEKISNSFFRKDSILTAGIVFTYIIFRKPIESFLSKTVVKHVLSQIDSIWYNDIIFILIAIISIILVVKRFRNYTPSKNLTSYILISAIIYLLYRLVGSTWDFTALSNWSSIKYADLLIITALFQLLLHVPKKVNIEVNGLNSFYDDKPLGFKGNDELGYSSYAKLLGKKILSSHFDKSFAIGINGKWGLGKTSFIDLLKRELENKDVIEINYNAWNSHAPKAIIKDFFETVQVSIRPYHSSLSRLFIQYSNKLVAINSNTVTQSIQTTVSALSGFDSLNSLYQDINKALMSINKKIVIYIDDLDRLDKDEIIEVIRLIRNTANFHNTFFIVAYDRNYVINALKQQNPYKQEAFLDKIFQIEVSLPFFKKDILRYKLAEKLKAKLPEGIHSTIETEVIGSSSSVPIFLNDWLESMRDVTRLANALLLNLSKLAGEIVFNDFMRMELLRLKSPSAYELLHRKTLDFLDTASSNSPKEHHYQLKTIKDQEKTKLEETEKGISTYFELHLFRNHSELSIPKNDISKIIEFVNGIFGGGFSFSLYSRSHLSIVYPSKFNRYFAYTLLEGTLSEIEFSNARDLMQDKFNTKITEWVSDGLEFELQSRFSEIKSFDNREDFEKIIIAIFHLANQTPQNPSFSSRNLVGYDGKDLMDKMSNYNNKLVEKYYPEKDGIEILKAFIKELFIQAKTPFIFESDLIRQVCDEFSVSIVLTKEELNEISIEYFRIYCQETEKLDSYVWHLFHNSKKTEWVSAGGSSYTKQENIPDITKETMKNFILNKDLNGFLFEIITLEPFYQKKFAISNVVIIDLFDNWKAFEEALSLKDEKDSNYLNEFKSFLTVYASEDYSHYVNFKFEVIPIQEKKRKKK